MNASILSDAAAEVAGFFGDFDLAALPPALRRPGPQPCNQIPPSFADAVRRLGIRPPREWDRLRFLLRVGRADRRIARAVIRPEVCVLAAELRRLRHDLDAVATSRRGA